jgi:hypothetical protein
MRKVYRVSLLLLFLSAGVQSVSAQNSFFTAINENDASLVNSKRTITPVKYNTLKADINHLRTFLWALPSEKKLANKNATPVLELPMPDGSMARFQVWESSIMEPGLEAKFPEMKTFAGVGIDDPYATIRFDYNPYFGFHAQILSPKGRVYIDPYAKWDVDHYMSYYTLDNKKISSFTCEIKEDAPVSNIITAGPCRGTQLFTYRLALACTGEYAVAVCAPNAPTVPATAAAMLTTVNRVTGVYETEISLRMVLIANNNLLIYLDGATDPYTNNNGGTMLGQNQANIDNVIGSANYDIGHVVSTGGGGVANLRVPCVNGSKARGVTGLSNPVGDNFDIDYVAHEMGHQWGGNHTFNSTTGSCNGNRNGSTAYEVGSGTTIQAYAGICGTDNTQPHSDPFFHTLSFDEISNYITTGNGNNCKVATNTGNTLPVITAMNNNGASIPINTPFTLTGAATDADNDPLSYCWEEWDLGPSTTWNGGATSTTAPIFKSRAPIASGSRTFPDIAVILAGYPANPTATMGGLKGETLPTVARDLKFRLTVRDVHPGTPVTGGIVTGGEGCQTGFTATYVVHVINTTGPFAVTVPNGGESYPASSTQTVTWNVVGTDQAPISVANVKISLSTDGGLTYPTVLAASTPNDGSEALTMPAATSTTARIKVEAVGNVFFDISNANFNITAPTGTFDFTPPAPVSVACGTVNTAGITLSTVSILGYVVPVNLSATGNPAGTTVSFVPNPVVPGNSTVVTLTGLSTLIPGNYPITVTGTSGAIVKTVVLTYTVNAGAGPTIGTAPIAKQVCAGLNTNFTVVSATGTGYQWQVSINGGGAWNNVANGGVYSGATTATLNITGATTAMDTYQYRVIVNGQCGSTTSTAAILTVNALPVVTASASATSVCAGSIVILTTTGANTYSWSAGTTPGTGNSVTANPQITTTYVVTGTNTTTGCINTAQVTVTATAKPTLVLTASPYTKLRPGLPMPAGSTMVSTTITATASSATTNNFVYTWSYSGPGPAQTFNGNTHTVSLNNLGVYTVTAADAGNLTCVSPPVSITISDSASSKLFIYPSPNNGIFTVSYYSPGASSSNKTRQQITIYDSKGSRVLSQEYEVSQPYQLHKIDLRRNGGGVYYIVLREANGNEIKTGEVVIK